MKIDLYTGTARNYIDEIMANHLTSFPQTIHYCRLLISYAQKQKDAALLGFACYYLGEAYYYHSDSTKALSAVLDAVRPLTQVEDYALLTRCYNLMGVIYSTQGNTPSAMEQYFIALRYCHKYHYYYLEGILNSNIASSYYVLQDYQSAARHFRAALTLFKKGVNEPTRLSNLILCTSSYGQCLCHLDKLDQAEKVKEHLLELLEQIGDEQPSPISYLFLSHYYLKRQNAPLTDRYIRMGIECAKSTDNFVSQADDYQAFCRLLLDTGRYQEFLELYSIVDVRSKELNITYILFINCQLWVSYLKATDQTEAYYLALERYYELSEQQSLEDMKMAYSSMQICFSYDKALRRQKRLERKEEQLRRRSEIDEMTGLANRFRLNDYLDEVLEKAHQEQSPLAIEILDIDCFKQYNDTYGHMAGDECLRLISSELKAISTPDVFCARYGGDEFIIVYTHKTQEEVLAIAAQLKERIAALQKPHATSNVSPYVTISQGIFWRIPRNASRAWDYLFAADQALYKLKRTNKNAINLYT